MAEERISSTLDERKRKKIKNGIAVRKKYDRNRESPALRKRLAEKMEEEEPQVQIKVEKKQIEEILSDDRAWKLQIIQQTNTKDGKDA